MPPAFVINLDRSPERLAAARERLAAVGVTPVRFSGIDASAHPERIAAAVDGDRFRAFMRRPHQPGEIGCALSHFALWETLADNRLEAMLVLEDDAVPVGHFAAIPDVVEALPDDWEICVLSGTGTYPLWSAAAGPLTIHRYWRPGYLSSGYLVHRRILRHRDRWPPRAKLWFAIDAWRYWAWLHGVAIYTVIPRPIRSDRKAASTIDGPGAGRAKGAATAGQALRSLLVRLSMYPRALSYGVRTWLRLRRVAR